MDKSQDIYRGLDALRFLLHAAPARVLAGEGEENNVEPGAGLIRERGSWVSDVVCQPPLGVSSIQT